MHKFLLCYLSLLLLNACASVPMHDSSIDANAKEFKPLSEKAKIYIYRNELFAGPHKIRLSLDGVPMGETAPNTFHLWEVEPGSHKIECATGYDKIKLETKKGKIYFIWQEMKNNFERIGCQFHIVTEAKGKKDVLGCKLAKSGLMDE